MSDDIAVSQTGADDERFAEAIAQATSWGAANHTITGIWTDRRRLSIGVGIISGDEVETSETLQRLVPAGISIRTRVASGALAELRQLQIEVFNYLEDANVWGRWAVGLGHDRNQHCIEVGLLPESPASIADQVHARFPGRPVTFAKAGRARAL